MSECRAGRCGHDPAFWQPLDLRAKDAEEDDHKSPLAGLVQDYYGPHSMLREVTENIASVSSTSAPSATSLAGTSASASVDGSAAASSSSKQRTLSFLLVIVLARALQITGLYNSLVQVAFLACLGG